MGKKENFPSHSSSGEDTRSYSPSPRWPARNHHSQSMPRYRADAGYYPHDNDCSHDACNELVSAGRIHSLDDTMPHSSLSTPFSLRVRVSTSSIPLYCYKR